MARLEGQPGAGGCISVPMTAAPRLFPEPLQKPNPNTLFDLPEYDRLPPPASIASSGTARLPVSQLSRAENARALGLLTTAYQKLGHDKRVTGLAVQGTLHQLFCMTRSGDAHLRTGGAFLAWHRAFLFFHERLLRWQLEQARIPGAEAVRLPYWDVTSFSESGGVYLSQPGLENGNCRTWIPPDSPTATSAIGSLILGLHDNNLRDCADDLFNWHIRTHQYVGGNMQTLSFAGFDPIFYALHASVDRMWTISPTARLTPDHHTCTFYDPYAGIGSWVKVDLANFGASVDLGAPYAPPGGVASLLLSLPVPSAIEVTLPSIGSVTTLMIVIRGKAVRIATIVPEGADHQHKSQTTRFPILPEVEAFLRTSRHDAVELFLQGAGDKRMLIGPNDWRLVR